MATRDLPCHPPESRPSVGAQTAPAGDGEGAADPVERGSDTQAAAAPRTADAPSAPAPGTRETVLSAAVPSAAVRPSGRPVGPPRPPDSTAQGPQPVFRPTNTPPLPPGPPGSPGPSASDPAPEVPRSAPDPAPEAPRSAPEQVPAAQPTAPAAPGPRSAGSSAPAEPPPSGAAPSGAVAPPTGTGPGAGLDAQAPDQVELSKDTAPVATPPPAPEPAATEAEAAQAGPASGTLVTRYQHLPMQAPAAVPTVAPELDGAQRKPRNGDSTAQRGGRALRRLVSSAVRETAEATALASRVRQPISVGRHVAVSSIRGGAGKTTVAALLGMVYAHYRRDAVLTLEADPALGTLPVRMGAESIRWTCGDVARIVDPAMQLTDITGYLVQLPQGGWLLPGSQGTVGVRLELAEYAAVMTALRGLFGMCVVDCETLPAELARAALHAAHARVLVAPATVEGVASTRSVVDWMVGLPRPVLPSTVIVLTQSSPDMTLDLTKATRHLAIAGATVLTLPYDRHLAAGGAVLTSHLAQDTRSAATHLAAELLDRALHVPR